MWDEPNVSFVVPGLPIAQGSKTPVPLTRSFPVTVASAGDLLRLVGMRESAKGLDAWRKAVRAAGEEAMSGQSLIEEGPVVLLCEFWFPRPKSHYGTGRNASTLKESAPEYPTGKPDVDKLVRSVGDALTGVVFKDDSQVVTMTATKRYGAESARITIAPHRYTSL